MELEGKRFEELQEAILSALPSYESLEYMVRIKLDKNLRQIAVKNGLSHVIFKLIRSAEAQGKVVELVRGARQQNPGNRKLKAFSDKFIRNELGYTIKADIPLQDPPRDSY